VVRVAFSHDGKVLATAFGADQLPGKITVWDIATGKKKATLAGHETMVFALAFSPDGKVLASGGYDKTLRLWDLDSGKELHEPQRLGTPIYRLVFGGDGKTLYSVGAENRARLWDVAAWRERLGADGPSQTIASLAWSPDGRTVASASGGNVWLWESATGKLLRKLETDTWAISAVAFSAEGKALVAASHDGTLHVWDPATEKEPRRIPGGGLKAEQMALAPNGTTVAVWSSDVDHTIVLRDLATGKELRRLEVPAENPGVRATLNSLRFSPDGRTLYSGSGTHLAVLRWDVVRGNALPAIGKHDGGLNGVALSPDGRSVAAVTIGGSLYLWEVATGQARLVVKDAGYATSVAFSPDGWLLAVANAGNHRLITGKEAVWSGAETRDLVRLVRIADGKVVGRFAGHAGGIGCLGFSPDGYALASGGRDTTIVLWDVQGAGAPDLKERVVLKPEELSALWADLRGEAAAAHGAMNRLMAGPTQAVGLFGEQLKPVKAVDAERLGTLLRKLDSDQFSDREEAAQELKKLGDGTEPGLRKALKGDLPVETRRRVEEILTELVGAAISAERLRALRAIEVLERIGDKDACDLLKRLSEGAAGAWLTEEARETLQRVERQRKTRP
jgi:WD40 repeat protein